MINTSMEFTDTMISSALLNYKSYRITQQRIFYHDDYLRISKEKNERKQNSEVHNYHLPRKKYQNPEVFINKGNL